MSDNANTYGIHPDLLLKESEKVHFDRIILRGPGAGLFTSREEAIKYMDFLKDLDFRVSIMSSDGKFAKVFVWANSAAHDSYLESKEQKELTKRRKKLLKQLPWDVAVAILATLALAGLVGASAYILGIIFPGLKADPIAAATFTAQLMVVLNFIVLLVKHVIRR